ncbi:hypothetical protein A2V68_00335 [candidate division Kazan bacterium RBG_13_50_9]|uniref:Regulatory protein RecX n=1 Tax=candidate division Kazan bacterium RBG_13_50_9 TaxID=1798535 RepID=A0A1F4NS21_UNCK3|nr:MAG: hypothetical protein A2V68_00335 [candidate division Kazan bacterium RBG_13_50_9]
MPKITKIVSQSSNSGRVSVFVDEKFLVGIDKLSWIRYGLKIGDPINAALCQRLVKEGEEHKTYDKALKLLSYRPQSISEIKKKLSRRFAPADIDVTIQRLSRNGLLNDREFAVSWVRERMQTRHRSVNHLTAELRRKGIDRGTIQIALETSQADDQEVDVAVALLQKRLAASGSTTINEKLKAYLSRRGFTYKTIAAAAKKVKCPDQVNP